MSLDHHEKPFSPKVIILFKHKKSPTLGEILDEHKGIGPGFDFLRVFLALSIVAVHTTILTGNRSIIIGTPLWFLEISLVPMFFALSGFLVTASGQRLSLKNFLINRGLRIVPALAVDVVVCALILGPIVTTVALSDYFTDKRFFTYFLNIIGWIHYKLPGVFEYYKDSRVNGALWTVPYEIICYIFISFLIFTKFIDQASRVAIFTAAYFSATLIISQTGVADLLPVKIKSVVYFLMLGNGARIVTAFLLGILIYQLRYFIPYSQLLLTISLSICTFCALFVARKTGEGVPIQIILLPVFAYIIVFIGLTPVKIPKFFKTGDYSYGIYLYHDPMIHVINTSFPSIALGTAFGGFFTYAMVVPLVIGIAWLSWHLIEKRILALRKKFSFVAKVRGVADAEKPLQMTDQPSSAAGASISNENLHLGR